ncbi:MAG: hypothetical protein DRI95_09840 [Bacteroidetes bacterium]|nr:MAG: hypothetical protein DRI95_09840 [Bacteroidota bacterium]
MTQLKTLNIILLFLIIHVFMNTNILFAQNSKINKLYEQLNQTIEDSSKINILNKLSKSYKRSNPDSALYFVEMAEALALILNDSIGLADSYNNYGNIYKNQGMYSLSMNYYQKSLEISEEIGYKSNLGKLYNNIGILHNIQKDYDLSMEYYEKSLKIKDELGDEKGKSYCYNNISTIYDIKKDFNKALEYCDKSLAIRKELNDSMGMGVCHNYLGRIYLHNNDFTKSLYHYNIAMKIKRKSGDQFGMSQILYHFSMISVAIGDSKTNLTEKNKYYKEAIDNAHHSLEISEKIGAVNNQRYAYEILHKASMGMKDYKKAVFYQKQSYLLRDSLFNLEKIKLIKDIELKYQTEKNQLQIEKLEKESELKSANLNSLQNQRIFLIVISILFFAFLISLIFAGKKLKLKSQTIYTKNERINAQNEEITQQNNSLQKYQDHLEEMIKEQTKSLIIAMENAKRADQLKTAFLENLSHEIRTPLNAIVGFSSLLESIGDISEDDKKFVSHINSGSESLLKIVDSIMHVSKIQIGDYKISFTEFNINRLMQQLYEEFNVSDEYLKKNKLELIVNLEACSENKTIYSDENVIRTILFNLIENAIKYTETGKVEFGYRLPGVKTHSPASQRKENTTLSIPNKSIQFYVNDTGIGISEEDIKYIFEKFRKIAPGKTKLYRGLGLGLTIAKSMVEQLNGKIWIESEIDKGSVFYFSFPLDKKV